MKDSIVLLLVIVRYGKEKIALLQKRSKINDETGKPEDWAGAHQLTVVGRIEQGETPKAAILREMKQELNESVAKTLEPIIREVAQVEKSDKIITMFMAEASKEFLKEIRPFINQRKIKLIRKEDVPKIKTLAPRDRANGIGNPDKIVMRSDEKAMVKQYL